MSLGSLFEGALNVFVFVIVFVFVFVIVIVMSPHLFNQMSQGHKSLGSLFEGAL